jgi:drug/metabolite transporter superfamily protein YnfA
MKRIFSISALLLPATALAHGPAWAYYIIEWYFVLMALVLGFAIFGRANLRRKLCAVGGTFLVAVLAWVTVGNIQSPDGSRQSDAIVAALGLSPVIGFVLGITFGRIRRKAL